MVTWTHHVRAEQLDNDARDVDLFRIREAVETEGALCESMREELGVQARDGVPLQWA